MHHTLTPRPTVWDSAPISVRLMCLIYQCESSGVSAAAEDKTSPPPEIILLSRLASPPLASLFIDAAGVNSRCCLGKESGILPAGGNNV